MAKKTWRVVLTEQERAVIILMAERFEGKRTEFQRMDRAVGILDRDFSLSDMIKPTGVGVMIDLPSLSVEEKECTFANEPYKTLKTFLQDQTVNYSRRSGTIGRIFINVLEAFEDAIEEEEVQDES